MNKEIATLKKIKSNHAIRKRSLNSKKADYTLYSDILDDKMAVIDTIHSGIKIEVVENYRAQVGLTKEQICTVLNISTKTMDRYKTDNKLLKKAQVEHFFGLTEVYKEGVEIFGTLGKFNIWLTDSNFALGSNRPLDLLVDSYGKGLVLTELANIDDGILA